MSAGRPMRGVRAGLAAGLLALGLAGCATAPGGDPRDPIEPFNRGVYRFNEVVDGAFLKPVATVYREVTPSPVRTGVSNFFANLADLWTFVNAVLQAKGTVAAETLMRVSVNSVFGIGGLIDIASEMGMERYREDFGQTMGRWGMPSGPYVVLPVLGPSTLRDTVGLRADMPGNPVNTLGHVPTRNSLILLQAVETRARLLGASAVLDQAALDEYSFTRDAYLQRRRNDIYDGNPPEEPTGPAEPAAEPPVQPPAPASSCGEACPPVPEPVALLTSPSAGAILTPADPEGNSR